ncbi:MAG: flagellin/flagellar hook associated protein, partial [Firmicutes bacterium]|nr:flagellin/flagellar hook associated protein [Bacillota bacterium]
VMTLNDADVGAIGGGDAVTTVPNVDVDTWNPLAHFTEGWPQGIPNPPEPITLHVGPMSGQTLELPNLQTNSYQLGLTSLDLVRNASGAMDVLGKAITTVSGLRGQLGAIENRLEHTYNVTVINAENLTASESKIRDADIALEMATLTRQQLLIQSSAAMMAQANAVRRNAVQALIKF